MIAVLKKTLRETLGLARCPWGEVEGSGVLQVSSGNCPMRRIKF